MQVPFDHTDCCTQYTGTAVVKVHPGSRATRWEPAEPTRYEVIDVNIDEARGWVDDVGYELKKHEEFGFMRLETKVFGILQEQADTEGSEFWCDCERKAEEEYAGARDAYWQAKLDAARGK